MYGQPALQRRRRVEGARRKRVVRGGGFGGGDVDDDDPVEPLPVREVEQVRGERGDQLLVAARVARQRATGPDLPFRRGQFAAYGRGQTVRQDAARLQFLGPLGQGAARRVVPAEDEGGERRKAAPGERRGLGDHAVRRVEPRR